MKGLVFTEFFEHVDRRYSLEVTEQLIEMSELPSGGVYTAVGTYDYEELVTLFGSLSSLTGVPISELLIDFGRYLFTVFTTQFPGFFVGIHSAFEFLPQVNNYVHVEVRKLYPDAELPTFTCEFHDADKMTMIYRSTRNLADLAEGLILGCIEHFEAPLCVRREPIDDGSNATRFVITPK